MSSFLIHHVFGIQLLGIQKHSNGVFLYDIDINNCCLNNSLLNILEISKNCIFNKLIEEKKEWVTFYIPISYICMNNLINRKVWYLMRVFCIYLYLSVYTIINVLIILSYLTESNCSNLYGPINIIVIYIIFNLIRKLITSLIILIFIQL